MDVHNETTLRPLYPQATTFGEIQANLLSVKHRIETACLNAGRDPNSVRLLPVSKTVPIERILLAYEAGCREFGENKVQECTRKARELQDWQDLDWSVIGHLQTNKAKEVARFAREFQALDSLRVAETLDRHLQQQGRRLDVMVQVNTSQETSKYGLAPEELTPFLRQIQPLDTLRVTGLMTLAMLSTDRTRVRDCFICLRELRDRNRNDAPQGEALHELSMGMSGDFDIAIEEGATVVRVGQAIFGARALPDSYYWPETTQESLS